MGYFEFVLGIMVLIVAALLWSILGYNFNIVADIFSNITPESINNYSINTTDVQNQYALSKNIFYFFYFFVVVLVFAWIIKTSIKEQK